MGSTGSRPRPPGSRSEAVRQLALRHVVPEPLPQERCHMVVRDRDMRELFVVTLYGVSFGELCTVPGGGNIVAAALARRGLDPGDFMFTLWDAGEGP